MDIVARVRNILLSPNAEWPAIALEPTDIAGLYKGYILLLAAIPALAKFLGFLVIGIPLGIALTAAITSYVGSLVGVIVVAFIAAKLAPTFGGRDDLVQGLKLAAFSFTAAWVGGIFLVIPLLGQILQLLFALYGIYLLYLGTTPVLSIAQDRAVIFVIVLFAACIILGFIVSAVLVTAGMQMM
ncbi:MAG TPA: Yip1 family protein [Aliidongia sp.]|nr:Yip1 family protein [Aliidongia sp.]